MDTRSLIALGMLLLVAVVALLKGAMQGSDVKDVILLLGGGVIGAVVPERRRHHMDTAPAIPAAPVATPPPALLALVIVAAMLLVSCSDAETWVKVADCATGPAWHIGDELICDDFRQTTFAFRPWEATDNAVTACNFCEGAPR